jgi:hypothetical protein
MPSESALTVSRPRIFVAPSVLREQGAAVPASSKATGGGNPIKQELFRNQIRSRNVFIQRCQYRSICGRKLA